ncbi:UDP-Gal or UDP-GlcNAc-dependent glycosyltransferase [Trypanosoma grayi]|uniref:UDP-Gal or UDP-GlcNAc-dependent glycosyltransferase n=1 Tax=Trypanosoma grayi TaxID=71804 RepID=UPI0004F42A71|nr:UDP-Gal or UDP-GlcNAc-dependent glycosyltransferase [Trypanosoma grayi]KEG08755.1 UDP-Gal or UDP-GlcNAc-dependent glycosyltransferase [Trypanosoma grayi]
MGNHAVPMKRTAVRLVIAFFVMTTVFFVVDPFDMIAVDRGAELDTHQLHRALGVDGPALRYITPSVLRTWAERDFLIVFGVPSVDIDARRRRRNLQRTTCWRFLDVATKANRFTGAMLVLYIMGRHPSHNYIYSAELLEEAAEWQDVIALSMNDALPTTNRTIASGLFWGMEAEIGMSRKTFLWFDMALRLFPKVPYIAKGDDDIFMRVPQYLADLRIMPRRGLYMGVYGMSKFLIEQRYIDVFFMIGFCYTMARDVAEQFVSYEPLRRLVSIPYSKERESEFRSIHMDHEDCMVGRVLLNELKYPSVVIAAAAPCRYNDARNQTGHSLVTPKSVVVHHVLESDYAELMDRFRNDTNPPPSSLWNRGNNFSYISCDP